MQKWQLPIILPMSILKLGKPLHWCRMLNINGWLLFANNVGLYTNSQQTVNTTVAYFVWVTMILWQQFGSILHYVWQWALKISWQPWSSPWCRTAALCSRTSILHVSTVTFLQISRKPNINLELDCIFGKPMKWRFQWCIVHMEILSTSHARIEYISVKNHTTETIGPMWANNAKMQPSP